MSEHNGGDHVTRRELDQRFAAQERYLESINRASAVAISKAEEALNMRLERMNEFREQIQSERVNYVRKEQLEVMEARIYAALRPLQDSGQRNLGLLGTGIAAGAVIGATVIKLLFQ